MSKLLRPDQLPPAGSLAFNMADLERQAEDLLRRAKARAAEIIGKSQADAVQIAAEARQAGLSAGQAEGLKLGRDEGFKAGREEGLQAARESTATLTPALTALVNECAARREGLVKQAERDLLALAAAVAGRIVRRELQADPDAVRRALVEAVGLVSERSRVTVRVNPADLAAVEAARPELYRRFAEIQDLKLAADETVERGGCRVLTEAGEVDMQVATQIERLTRLLAGEANLDAGAGAAPEGEAVT